MTEAASKMMAQTVLPSGEDLLPSSRPRHIAIIMDGNSRWAKRRGLSPKAGHRAGIESVRSVVEYCVEQQIEVLTLFAFSTENWQRPAAEVRALMALFLAVLKYEVSRLHQNGVRLRVIGDRGRFHPSIRRHIERAERLTADNAKSTLVIAADYGGRWDMVQAARRIAMDAMAGLIDPARIDEETVQRYVCLADLPPPDLYIRTAGEYRISNFLLWQAAYSEFYFSEAFWPDFQKEELARAIDSYMERERRFGRRDQESPSQEQAGC